ncbi:TetR/AcrR family transcriptional regulator [candidate division KSB1 bacterium]|nr:MAG: TetR/AcrR family transcriptional regulator [candidate division KSB1 bacterium]
MNMEEKKERILSVAQKIFARFGIQKTTMDEIAKMARMGKATLYYYFKSKEEIFAQVIHKESRVLKKKLQEAISKADTPQEKIKAYVLTRMMHLKELSNYYSTLTDKYLEHYSFVENERKDFTEYEIKTLTEILKQGIEQNVFGMQDVELAARMIAIALKGLEYPLIVENKNNNNMEDEINQMLNILFKGLEIR